MPVTVQGPDGNSYQFPDGTDKNAAIAYFKKKGIGAAPPTTEQPKARTVGNYLSEAVSGAGRGLMNDVTGAYQTVRHPIDTAKGLAKQLSTAQEASTKEFNDLGNAYPNKYSPTRNAASMLTFAENAPIIGGIVQHAEKGGTKPFSPESVGAASEGFATVAGPDIIGRGVGKVLPKVARAVTKTSPKEIGGLVKDTQNANAAGNAFSKVRSAIETAREKALKVGNEKYNTVNAKLNPIPSDMAGPSAAYAEAANSFGESLNQPPLLKRLGSLLEEPAKGETKSPVTYKDEQQLYSELGNELSRGGLNGPTYHAYDLIHEALGKDMQGIADLQGMGKQLSEARNYWRRMKQTFGKPLPKGDAATTALHSLAPELAEADTIGNRVRMLGSFDPEIPKHFEEMNAARTAAKGVEPGTPGVDKKINAEDIRNKKVESAQQGVQRVRNVGHKIVNYGIGLKALWNVFGGNFAAVPGDIGMGLAGYGATEAFARILERPAIRKLLTDPTPADIAQIPPELRGNLGPMLQAAQAKGIKVAPALIAATTGAAIAGQPRKGVAAALTSR